MNRFCTSVFGSTKCVDDSLFGVFYSTYNYITLLYYKLQMFNYEFARRNYTSNY